MTVQHDSSTSNIGTGGCIIRKARETDIAPLADVERSAAVRFVDVGLGHITGSTMPTEKLLDMMNHGYLWVAVSERDAPIGFLGGNELDGYFYIAEISVAQIHQGKGVGKALMVKMEDEVVAEKGKFKGLSLTTYRDLDWNGPWYAKQGFVEVAAEVIGSGHALVLKEEGEDGHDLKRRCVMRKIF